MEMSAHVTPAEVLTGSPWASCLSTDAKWWPRLSCTYWEPASKVLWGSLSCCIAGFMHDRIHFFYRTNVEHPSKGSWDTATQIKCESRITHIFPCRIDVLSLSASASQVKKSRENPVFFSQTSAIALTSCVKKLTVTAKFRINSIF